MNVCEFSILSFTEHDTRSWGKLPHIYLAI